MERRPDHAPRESEWNKEALPSHDARDYFAESATQKMAEEMDPDTTHNWNTVRDVSVTRDENGATALGLQKTAEGYALYVVERTRGDAPVSVELQEKSPDAFDLARHYSQTASTFLPAELHHAFMRGIPDALRGGADATPESRSVLLAKAFLEVLPQTDMAVTAVEVPAKHRDGDATPEQQKEITELVTLVLRIDPDAQARVTQFLDEIPLIANAYTGYYRWLVSEISKMAVDRSSAFPPHYDRRDTADRIVHYDVGPMVTRHPKTEEEFTTLLAAEPFAESPAYRETSPSVPAFVNVDDIVGVFNAASWKEIRTSENRGVPRIMELARRMKEGIPDEAPIKLSKIDGKYYVTGDGRHRLAAMKALGVHGQIPALVNEARSI